MSAPTFEEAVNRFQRFLLQEGWPTAVAWVRAEDLLTRSDGKIIIRQNRFANAKQIYETGRAAGLGVMFDAVCTLGDATCAAVCLPADSREAELLMYPSDASLKLSVAVPILRGRIALSNAETEDG